MLEEVAQSLFLLGREVGQVCHFLQVVDVGKQIFGIGQMLVYVVKVGQKHFSPTVKLVQRFGGVLAHHFAVYLVKHTDRFDVFGS